MTIGGLPGYLLYEIYASAWCGMLKHRIPGNRRKAAEQSEAIWGAYRYDIARVTAKPLVTKWLLEDWEGSVTVRVLFAMVSYRTGAERNSFAAA